METYLKRTFKGKAYTVGRLSIGEIDRVFCDTLEPPVRELKDLNKDGDFMDAGEGKIMGSTAIPPGRYKITWKHSPSFKREMPYLENVPGFSNVMLHWGNDVKDTAGCILVGKNKIRGRVLQSVVTFTALENVLREYKEDIYINIQ